MLGRRNLQQVLFLRADETEFRDAAVRAARPRAMNARPERTASIRGYTTRPDADEHGGKRRGHTPANRRARETRPARRAPASADQRQRQHGIRAVLAQRSCAVACASTAKYSRAQQRTTTVSIAAQDRTQDGATRAARSNSGNHGAAAITSAGTAGNTYTPRLPELSAEEQHDQHDPRKRTATNVSRARAAARASAATATARAR